MATCSWATGVNGDWNVASNWAQGGVPNNPTADAIIDAPTATTYAVAIGPNAVDTVNSLSLNPVTNLAGSNRAPYNAAELVIYGTLAFAPGSPGTLGGSLQSFVEMANGSEIINPGTLNAFIQGQRNVLLTDTNGFYITNWLQSLSGNVIVDTKSI